MAVASARTRLPAPWVTGPSVEWTTTWIAVLALPPKCCWASSRAVTDSDPFACQPAPESSDSTLGAKAPSATMTSSHTAVVMRPWRVTKTPSRPRGPGR